MISLKKLIDGASKATAEPVADAARDMAMIASRASVVKHNQKVTPAEFSALLSAYVDALNTMGESGRRAVPALGDMISNSLTRVGATLAQSGTAEAIGDARRQVGEQLQDWAEQAGQHQKEDERTIRELVRAVASTAESTGHRDEKYGREISELSERLRAVASLGNLPAIRQSISDNTGALLACVGRMAAEGRDSVQKLNSEITEFQTRLQASERRANADPLTGLCNRSGFERRMETQMAAGRKFCVLVADMNGFKAINDNYGHLAGDDILRQFAGEMKSQLRPEDTIARWGGDEFVALIEGSEKDGEARAERVRRWALGDYKIIVDQREVTLKVDAAIGLALWDGRESAKELFERADREMYRAKEGAALSV